MELRSAVYDEARPLVDAMTEEMGLRYGEPGTSPADGSDFLPPYGIFLVGSEDGVDVACGGLRLLRGFGDGLGEVKRMYVVPEVRGQGLSRVLLRALLDQARSLGLREVWLETGTEQPEAISLYESEGFVAIPPYGHYRDDPRSRCFALRL